MNLHFRLNQMIKNFDDAMMCTVAADGTVHARPMAIGAQGANGQLWFVTSRSSLKAAELAKRPQTTVTMQSSSHFVSLTGRATLVEDPAALREVWEPRMFTWFEGGADDPDVALVSFTPDLGEYWKQGAVERLELEVERLRANADDHDFDPQAAQEHARVAL